MWPYGIISIVATLVIVAPVSWFLAINYRKRAVESKIGSAEEKAREIIDEALKTYSAEGREHR